MLKGKPRFDFYRPNTTPVEEWIEKLGPDVDNLLHMPYTYELAKDFLNENDDFSAGEKATLLFTAMTHDMQEAITGDKRKIDKTAKDEQMEAELLSSILNEVLASELDCVSLGKLTRAVEEVLVDENSKLGKAFSAIEKLGYAETALKAWEIRKKGDPKTYGLSPLHTSLGLLAYSVFSHQTFRMAAYAKEYPFVKNYLTQYSDEISEILEEAEELGMPENSKILNKSISAWNDFRASFNS
jgi:hypothetical protein